MAYDSIEWKSGDVITAEKLNQMESQITPLIGVLTDEGGGNFSSNFSYKDIHDAILDGRNIVIYSIDEYGNYILYDIHSIYEDTEYANFLVSILNLYTQANYTLSAESETDLLFTSGK